MTFKNVARVIFKVAANASRERGMHKSRQTMILLKMLKDSLLGGQSFPELTLKEIKHRKMTWRP